MFVGNEGWIALGIAILSKGYLTPETAFLKLFDGCMSQLPFTDEDTQDMIKLRGKGISFKEIGKMYGISDSTAFNRIKRFEKKRGIA